MNEDPQAGLTAIQANLGEVAASAIHNMVSLSDIINSMTAYAMLAYLPPPYGMLASTLLASNSTLSAQQIISAASLEHRRRMMQTEEVNAQGFLAKKAVEKKGFTRSQERRLSHMGPDGQPLLGRDASKFCEEPQRHSHNTGSCFKLHGRKSAKEQKAALASQQDHQDPDLEAYIALASAAVPPNSRESIIINSGASDHSVCNKSFLHDLVVVVKSVRVKVGNGQYVTATHIGGLTVGRSIYKHACYVPDMVYNLLSVQQSSLDPHQ